MHVVVVSGYCLPLALNRLFWSIDDFPLFVPTNNIITSVAEIAFFFISSTTPSPPVFANNNVSSQMHSIEATDMMDGPSPPSIIYIIY
jgi:hypothetical protein